MDGSEAKREADLILFLTHRPRLLASTVFCIVLIGIGLRMVTQDYNSHIAASNGSIFLGSAILATVLNLRFVSRVKGNRSSLMILDGKKLHAYRGNEVALGEIRAIHYFPLRIELETFDGRSIRYPIFLSTKQQITDFLTSARSRIGRTL